MNVTSHARGIGSSDYRALQRERAPVGVVHRILAAVFKAAVRDRRIVASPCDGTSCRKTPSNGSSRSQSTRSRPWPK